MSNTRALSVPEKMNNTLSSTYQWLTVLVYLGFTVFIIWCVFATQKK